MVRRPIPAARAGTEGAAHAHAPVAGIGVAHFAHDVTQRVGEFDLLAAVAELAGPVAQHIGHEREGILRLKVGEAGGDDEVLARAERRGRREGEVHAVDEAPAGEIDRVGAAIVQFDVFLQRVLARRMIHDFVDDDLAGKNRQDPKQEQGQRPHKQALHKQGWIPALE